MSSASELTHVELKKWAILKARRAISKIFIVGKAHKENMNRVLDRQKMKKNLIPPILPLVHPLK